MRRSARSFSKECAPPAGVTYEGSPLRHRRLLLPRRTNRCPASGYMYADNMPKPLPMRAGFVDLSGDNVA